ncbi:hypothetical protein [Streptomyces sp. NPDC058657]|uniref:hypothetical protein n=1 Tax=unclassified Streptomyces TaxID=2593676 RepID=UPI003656A967
MSTVTAPLTSAGPALADRVAALLPPREGHGWEAAPCTVWWTTRPTFRLTQAGRPGALILVRAPWRTEIAWQLDNREPYAPDLTLDRLAPEPVVREILRLILPRLDDATAAAKAHQRPEAARQRSQHLDVIGAAVRAHGVTAYRVDDVQPNSDAVVWGSGGVRYAAALVGSNPACNLSVTGPVTTVERVLPYFLREPAEQTPRFPVRGVRTRLGRRLAAHLAQFTAVDQLDDGGLSFGGSTGPFGYIAAPADPVARVRDTAPVAAELHGVGIDHLVHLAPLLTN